MLDFTIADDLYLFVDLAADDLYLSVGRAGNVS